MFFKMLFPVFTILFLCFLTTSNAIQCYMCSYSSDATNAGVPDDETCADDLPSKDLIRDCSKKYCQVVRIELLDPKGQIASMSRGCANLRRNEVVEDASQRTYFYSCQSDLCNIGNGKDVHASQHNYLGDKKTLYVQGIGKNSSVKNLFNTFLLLSIIIISFVP